MPVPAGVRVGGRQKGTPNRDKNALIELLKAECKNYRDPIVILADIACGEPVVTRVWVPPIMDGARVVENGSYQERMVYPDLDQQASCAKEVAQYIHPKRKAIEVTGELETGPQVHYHIPGSTTSVDEWAALTQGKSAAQQVAELDQLTSGPEE